MTNDNNDDGWWGVEEIIQGKKNKKEGFTIEDSFKKPIKTTDKGVIELPKGSQVESNEKKDND